MGTNYYARKRLGRKPKEFISKSTDIHIGKSSCGWRFNFQKYDNYYLKLTNFDEYKNLILDKKYVIFNEYGHEVNPKDLLELIEDKQKNNNPDNFKSSENVDGYRFNSADFT